MRIARISVLAAMLFAAPAQVAAAPGSFDDLLLAAQNAERQRIGQPELVWSEGLAAQAQLWANSLARRGSFEHSSGGSGQGENLWMGTSGAFSPEQMIGGFISEARLFRPGRFPYVSRTGNWADVGHYSQIIWPGTREVGCALARGRDNDVLVCRYWPAGNVMGQQVP